MNAETTTNNHARNLVLLAGFTAGLADFLFASITRVMNGGSLRGISVGAAHQSDRIVDNDLAIGYWLVRRASREQQKHAERWQAIPGEHLVPVPRPAVHRSLPREISVRQRRDAPALESASD